MSASLFRPRRRPLLRAALAFCLLIVSGGGAIVVVWLREHVVPPDCVNPDTLVLVRRSLIGRFHLPSSVTLENIETQAGGYLAFRFACEADIAGFDRHDLPPDTPIPATVHYVSRLTDGGRRHEVTVSIQPLLILEPVQ